MGREPRKRLLLTPMLVSFRHPQAAGGVPFKIKFDHHRGLVTHNPPVVTRLDGDDLWRGELQSAAVRVLNVDLAGSQESDMRVHAEIRAHDGFHVPGPAKSGRVDHPFDATGTGPDDIDLNPGDVAVFTSLYRREKRIGAIHQF